MQVKVTDKQLIEIYNIRNISKISFYDLVEGDNVLPGLVVFFDGQKHINLCAADKYFPEFVRKVVEVYHAEIKKDPTNPFSEVSISIDDKTKEILESGKLETIPEDFKFYSEKKGYKESLLYEIDEVKLLLPIIKYHLKELFSHTDIIINWQDGITGYRTNYVLPATISGLESEVFLNISKENDTSYIISARGLTPNNSSIKMELLFSEHGILVSGNVERYGLTYYYSYKPENGIIKGQRSITMNDTMIDYQDGNLPQVADVNNKNLTTFDIPKELEFYALPWDAYIGFSENVEEVGIAEAIRRNHLEYFYPGEKGFMRKEFISEMYASRTTQMTLTRAGKSVNAYLWDNRNKLYIVETSFLDDISGSGFYEEHLRGKSFYHICKLKDLQALVADNLVSVDEDKGILVGSDFMNKSRLLSIIEGEN